MIHEAQKETEKLVTAHWDKIEKLALKLIAQEIVESDELSTIMGSKKVSYTMPESL